MQTSKTLARLYCPNPKDPTEGLRQKANGVWERNEVIDGKRKSFSSRDPIEAWRKRSEFIITREERRQEEQLLEELGPVPAELSARIMSEKDEKKLSVWNKTAARVESVEQFMKSTAETIIV